LKNKESVDNVNTNIPMASPLVNATKTNKVKISEKSVRKEIAWKNMSQSRFQQA
jgi:hypothetical protein